MTSLLPNRIDLNVLAAIASQARSSAWPVLFLLAASSAVAAPVASGDSPWQLAAASSALDAQAPAVRRREDLLFWSLADGRREPAAVAHLLVEAPYAQVQAAVQATLQAQDGVEERSAASELAYLPDDWDEVLLSRRADLRALLVAQVTAPMLEAAVAQGALTAGEAQLRLQRAHRRTQWAPQDRHALAAFRDAHYPQYCATRSERQGRGGGLETTLCVFDVSAAFGTAATALRIERTDTYANPEHSVLKTLSHIDPFGPSPPPRQLRQRVVPAALFQGVRAAIAASAPQAALHVAASPLAWTLPAAPLPPAPPVAFVAAGNGVAPVPVEALPWDALVGMAAATNGARYPQDLLALPDGDLLLSVQVLGGPASGTRLWRLHRDGEQWQAALVWQGEEGARRLMADAQGGSVWFRAKAAGDEDEVLHVYDVATRQLRRHAVAGDAADDRGYARWELDAAQRPAYFAHHSDAAGAGAFGSGRFTMSTPATPPPSDGLWTFARAFAAPRQALMDGASKGNAQLWPVRLRDPRALWVEDAEGLAELDPGSGRVLRAFALPQRFGVPDPFDASGVAQWVPTPLGSLQGGWIATGFVLLLDPHGTSPPRFAPAAGGGERFVGMHVVDLRDGRVRLSALLGRAETLKAAARSANGRLLALGSDAPGGGLQVAVWPLAATRPPLPLAAPARAGLATLAFAWNGQALWALTDRGLLRWALPAALHDPAAAGAYPEHSTD